ncbi:hypothetical protein [Bacillus albus]|uniref:hypothetical protein n=1 Tax=Bacillus albus TaxID=2026189 RepID=UPI00101FEA9A|nr:hypothetical protein [Bacillus albus]
MKKKSLVTTAALSLSLTSLAPITSLAATQNDAKEDTISPRVPAEDTDEAARRVADGNADWLNEDYMKKLNAASQKLGYLKGSELTVKINRSHYGDDMFDPTGKYKKSKFRGDTSISKVYFHGDYYRDPSLDIQYNPNTEEITIKKIKNQESIGELPLVTEVNYKYDAWEKYGAWFPVQDRRGFTSTTVTNRHFNNFEKAPELSIDHHTNTTSIRSTDIDKLVPTDYYDVKSSAGKVKSEFVKRPDYNLGEQTATIRVWDEYGEETPSDLKHNKKIDVKFDVFDDTNTFENKDLRGWNISGKPYNFSKSHEPLSGDTVLYSQSNHNEIKPLFAKKQYQLEPGATYKFTTFIKTIMMQPDTTAAVLLTLKPDNGDPEREIFASKFVTLPEVDSGFKELSTEFTVENGENKSSLCFEFSSKYSLVIDSFKLEKIK